MSDVNFPVLFLDVDGVLNRCGKSAEKLEQPLLANLVRIVESTDCRIVLSSTWRCFPHALAEIEHVFTDLGLIIHSHTPDLVHGIRDSIILAAKQRGDEIQAWMDQHGTPARFCILDDNSDMADLRHKLIQTNSFEGLTDPITARAIQALSSSTDH